MASPEAAPRLAWEIVIPAGLLVLALIYGIYWYVTTVGTALMTPPKSDDKTTVTSTVDDVKPRDWTRHGSVEEPAQTTPEIPRGQIVSQGVGAATPPPEPVLLLVAQQLQANTKVTETQTGLLQRMALALASMGQTQQAQKAQMTQQATQASHATQTQQPEKPRATPLVFLVNNKSDVMQEQQASLEKEKDSLLEPAHQVRPFDRKKVLYRRQQLAGRILDSINSDLPGTVRIELTVPVYSPYAKDGDAPLLDKATVIIARYSGEVKYGQVRIPIQVEEAQPPNGDIIEMKAMGGDQDGRPGATGTVNNHLGKLGLSVAINAVLQLGVKGLAGTPGQGQYYQNPVQQAAQESASSAAQSINGMAQKQLNVPPTIEKDAHGKDPFVTILLEKNLSFYRTPKIVK